MGSRFSNLIQEIVQFVMSALNYIQNPVNLQPRGTFGTTSSSKPKNPTSPSRLRVRLYRLYTKTSREAVKDAKIERYLLTTSLRGFALFA